MRTGFYSWTAQSWPFDLAKVNATAPDAPFKPFSPEIEELRKEIEELKGEIRRLRNELQR